MRYQAVRWHHDFPDEPVLLLSEIDDDGYERRKIEEYRNGRLDLADSVTEVGSTALSESVLPPLDEINAQPEFDARAITREEFESAWRRAWDWFDDDNES